MNRPVILRIATPALLRLERVRTRRARGFSLVELTVAVALMAIIVLYLTESFTMQQRTGWKRASPPSMATWRDRLLRENCWKISALQR